MIHQSKATIFLADQRRLNETSSFRSMPVFTTGESLNEHTQAFGNMYFFSDDMLAGGCSVKMAVKEYSFIILAPVAGAVVYIDQAGNRSLVAAGQTQVITAEKGVTVEIHNPFHDQPVNFLQIWIKAAPSKDLPLSQLSTYKDVNQHLNNLVNAFQASPHISPLPFSFSLGKFYGRGETMYNSKHKKSGIFIFVIEGAFEVAGRLLHARDGLALWETTNMEIEALSNDAIIMIVELGDYSSC